jgi:hypothetical protein
MAPAHLHKRARLAALVEGRVDGALALPPELPREARAVAQQLAGGAVAARERAVPACRRVARAVLREAERSPGLAVGSYVLRGIVTDVLRGIVTDVR